MTEASDQGYRRCALARLARAEELYRTISPEARPSAFCELAQVASLIWDAVIDAISIAYMNGGSTPFGKSIDMRGYAKSALPHVYQEWQGPIRLHNFQHRPYQPTGAFEEACLITANLLTGLNGYLPEPLRLPVNSFGWLTRIGSEEVS